MKRFAFLAVIFIGTLTSCSTKNTQTENNSNSDTMIVAQQKQQVDIPEWTKHAVIYEVNLRQYTPKGTFKEFSAELPRLKELGVDILWFMPIYPIGMKNRKGSLGSYYSIRDYQAVNPDHGTMADFKDLVNQAHALGMHVILDWVANHSSWDNRLIYEHPEWYSQDSLGNVIVPEGTDWSDVADFNYSHKGLWDYMIASMKFWLQEANVDGFRCDVAGMVPTEFWAAVYPALKEVKPDVFMLAEWDDPSLHEVAFHMSYAWDMHKTFNAIAKGEKDATALDSMLVVEKQRYLQSAYRMNFTSNHDENSWNGTEFERLGPAYECFAALTYVIPGMPLIYSGQEAGNEKRLKFFDRDPIVWKADPMAELYKQLNALKHSNPTIWNGTWGGDAQRIQTADKDVFAILRTKDANKVLGVFNLQNKASEFLVPESGISGTYYMLGGQEMNLMSGQKIALKPFEYLILSR